jgi:hypothetical protein
VHTDRGENHDPTGTLITAQALNGGLDRPARNKRTVPAQLTTTAIYANAVGEEEQSIATKMW